tara:strand:- start:74 stop:805 length:732 start_codon:yes stop_codon:yes gene_type:complete
MSFEVTYNGDIKYIKIFYSTNNTRECKYHGDFYKKMDAIANDLKRLKQELDEDSEKAAKIAKDAANKALAERFGPLRYIIDEELWDEDMIIGKMLKTKKEEMLTLAQMTLNYDVLSEEDGAEEYKIHLEGGKIAINGKNLELDTSKDGNLFGACYWDWDEAKLERLENLDWFVIWTEAASGTFRAKVEEGEFNKEKINMKENLLHYDNLSIDDNFYGEEKIDSQLEIFFGDETRECFEMAWAD